VDSLARYVARVTNEELTVATRWRDGEFVSGLWVGEGSSSDHVTVPEEPTALAARDVLMAVPFLRWKPDGVPVDAHEFAPRQARAVGAVAAGVAPVPLNVNASQLGDLELGDGVVRLQRASRSLSRFSAAAFPVHPRVAWFLALRSTLSVQIDMEPRHIATFTAPGKPSAVAVMPGSASSKAYRGLVERAATWKPVSIGNTSVLAGSDPTSRADFHTRAYSAKPHEGDIPTLEFRGNCLGCGAKRLSREHCTPNRVARDQEVRPVVARILCAECNGYFVRWAIKTALTLSVASDVRLPPGWMRDPRNGPGPGGVRGLRRRVLPRAAGIRLRRQLLLRARPQRRRFLATYSMGPVMVCVVRRPAPLGEIPHMPRRHPGIAGSGRLGSGAINLNELNNSIAERLIGHSIVMTPSVPKPVRGQRPQRRSAESGASKVRTGR
jgi:hypothetical protein